MSEPALGEAQTLARLRADEQSLDRALAEARAAAAALVEGTREECGRIREAARTGLEGELAALRAEEAERSAAAKRAFQAGTAEQVSEVQRRAELNRPRALALLLRVIAGEDA